MAPPPAKRPDMTPTDRAKPLFESAVVGIGVLHLPAGDPEWKQDRTGYCWPAIGLPRVPYELRVDGSHPFVADRNTVFFTNVGVTYRRRNLTPQGLQNDWIDIRPEVLAEMLTHATGRRHEPTSRFPWAHGPSPTNPLLRIHALNAMLREGDQAEPLRVEETVLDVFRAIIDANVQARTTVRRRRPSPAQARFQQDAVEQVRRTLATAPERTHTLTTLAAGVHMSPFHLCRVFKRHTGLPVHRYLERLRLRRALAGVLDTKDRMISIAAACGFCSEAHLSNAFMREFGHRPSRIRRDRSLAITRID
ncbi:MAG: helix-turn-helix transcriptional regulator [Planctomycetes bacterium]|nr:helix-turn-helix transcriptional regulator [Planctomycetota bacterium]